MWLDDIEFEIIKRIRYGLSLENLANDSKQLGEILLRLKNKEVIHFNANNEEITLTTKGLRLYSEKEYQPKSV